MEKQIFSIGSSLEKIRAIQCLEIFYCTWEQCRKIQFTYPLIYGTIKYAEFITLLRLLLDPVKKTSKG